MKHKGDIEIGFRAFEELKRIAPPLNINQVGKRIKVSHSAIYEWKNGGCPDAKALQSLCYCGADIVYILTGRRSKNENN